MIRILAKVLIFNLLLAGKLFAQQTPYESGGKNVTATYEQCISFYRQLCTQFSGITLEESGMTDAGFPLHLVLLGSERKPSLKKWHAENKCILFINNGIHPGEPDGIDASMLWVRDLLVQRAEGSIPDNIGIAIIPVYNIGGCLNRSPFQRVDQNGPEEFGSRGNSQNLDLNRDFIKCDSREARSFARLFHQVDPDIFIDNHVSDGADYPYVMTMATTQHNKLGGPMGKFLHEVFEPALFEQMRQKGFPMIPYVNVWGKDASLGWKTFFDSPRYSSGFAALHNVFSFVPETHMLKPYPQRVEATYTFMQSVLDYCRVHAEAIQSQREAMKQYQMQQQDFPLDWETSDSNFTPLEFQGYRYKKFKSGVSGLDYYSYDRQDTFRKTIPFYNYSFPTVAVKRPLAYVVPQGWWKVIELLQLNQVEMYALPEDDSIDIEAYQVKEFTSGERLFEWHHVINSMKLEKKCYRKKFRRGDWYIPLNQDKVRFIIEVLEPQGMDSYFYWNFFDPVLVQKEGYSEYSFEPLAADYLNQHPEVRTLLNEAIRAQPEKMKTASAQLEFVYKHSPYAEPAWNEIPVFRVVNAASCLRDFLEFDRKPLGNKWDE